MVVSRGALIRRLLLFEEVLIDSIRLTEVPAFVELFGVSGLERVLRSGCLRLKVEPITVAEIGSFGSVLDHEGRRTGSPLPPFSYAFSGIEMFDLDRYVKEWLDQAVAAVPDLGRKAERGLRCVLRDAIVAQHPEIAQRVADHLLDHLAREPDIAGRAVAMRLSKELGRDVTTSEFDLELQSGPGEVNVETDVVERFRLAADKGSEIVKGALLAIGALHQTLAEMQTYEAITGFQEEEATLFLQHASFLVRRDDPARQEGRFDRVLELQGLPDVHDAVAKHSLNAKALLKLRDSDECREFRRWLRTIDNETDAELQERFDSVRERFAKVVHSPRTRAVRFVVSTMVDLIPGSKLVTKVTSTAMSAADQFLFDRVLSRPGPATFLGRTYASLFRDS